MVYLLSHYRSKNKIKNIPFLFLSIRLVEKNKSKKEITKFKLLQNPLQFFKQND
jgi:hypothetical protein